MVSNSEEANWNNLQKQLKTDRRKQLQKPANIKRTYEILAKKWRSQQPNQNSEATNELKSKKGGGGTSSRSSGGDPGGSYLTRYNHQQTLTNEKSRQKRAQLSHSPDADQNMILNSSFYNNYSPLSTPANYRNNNTPARMSDPYGINPLPNIRSPYYSARDTFHPNLESWGVNNSSLYDDPLFLSRHSPFLSYYSSFPRSQKPYIVVPTYANSYKPASPVFNDTNFDSTIRLNYINPIPYSRRPLIESYSDSGNLKSDEYIKNAQKLLDKKPSDYDGEELFSTKFLEELEYRPEPKQSSKKKKNVRISNNKTELSPRSNSQSKKPANSLAVDIAERIYEREIELLIRQVVESAYKEEMMVKLKLQKPIYESIYEPVIDKMVKDIAREVVEDYERKIQILQNHAIKKVAREQIVNNLILDHMLDSVAQQGKSTDDDDQVTQLLDTMSLEILLNCHNEVKKFKEKTLKNYPIKKFHLNSFMNVALDILVAELSSSLEDDMKELEKIEKV